MLTYLLLGYLVMVGVTSLLFLLTDWMLSGKMYFSWEPFGLVIFFIWPYLLFVLIMVWIVLGISWFKFRILKRG